MKKIEKNKGNPVVAFVAAKSSVKSYVDYVAEGRALPLKKIKANKSNNAQNGQAPASGEVNSHLDQLQALL